ncbi:MAG: aminotransferase class V-fold PLP-dependent enzyme [Nitrososphaerota archaeon]
MMHQASNVKNDFSALKNVNYLDSAGAGLPPLRVLEAMNKLTEDWGLNGEKWEEWLMNVVELRSEFGGLINASRDEIGVVPSVSVGLAALASSFSFKDKKVVVSELNFPTNVILWQRMKESGLIKKVEVLKQKDGIIPVESYRKAIDENTALVSIDYVSWFSGARENVREVAEIAHKNGAYLLVDAFHALSVIPVDVKKDGIDMLASGFYKWLCGPHGIACIYMDNELLKDRSPAYIGWHGIKDNVIERILAGRDPFDIPFPLDMATPSATAARFEWGTWSPVVVKGALEALRYTKGKGIESRYQSISRLKKKLMEGLQDIGANIITPDEGLNPGAGIVTFAVKNQSEFVTELKKRKIIVSGRFKHVRVSPHFYNTQDDIDDFLIQSKSIGF